MFSPAEQRHWQSGCLQCSVQLNNVTDSQAVCSVQCSWTTSLTGCLQCSVRLNNVTDSQAVCSVQCSWTTSLTVRLFAMFSAAEQRHWQDQRGVNNYWDMRHINLKFITYGSETLWGCVYSFGHFLDAEVKLFLRLGIKQQRRVVEAKLHAFLIWTLILR